MTNAPIRRTWEQRDLVLLEAIARTEEAGEEARADRLAETTGLGTRETQLGLRALYDGDYIAGIDATGGNDIFDLLDVRLLERGLRTVGQWPAEDRFDAFLAVVEQQIAEASSDEERTRLEQVRDAALGVGRDVLTSVLSAWARGQVGL